MSTDPITAVPFLVPRGPCLWGVVYTLTTTSGRQWWFASIPYIIRKKAEAVAAGKANSVIFWLPKETP